MPDLMEALGKNLEMIALEVVTLDSGDIPAMGKIINVLEELDTGSAELEDPRFRDLVVAAKEYLEKLILSEVSELRPLETGISALQSFHHSLLNGESPRDDVPAEALRQLGAGNALDAGESRDGPEKTGGPPGEAPATGSAGEPEQEEAPGTPTRDMDEEDRQILQDFVVESRENLESIEVNLVNLEQDPEDLETINSIFRPFHTVKGVSGFLGLSKINKLSHSAENLLDKARNRQLRVDEDVIDIVLESVDHLKRMIDDVQDALDSGDEIRSTVDIRPLLDKIDLMNEEEKCLGNKKIGEILVNKGALKEEDLQESLDEQKREPGRKIGEILISGKKSPCKEVISAVRNQKRYSRGQSELQVKVDTLKLDNMVDLTGELVIAQAMLRQNPTITASSNQKLYHTLNQLNQITSGLQRVAMSMRMVPIKSTFQKMVRLVRDLAKHSGKEVGLEMYGEDTEIDRNVVDELYEPMVHMIRNAVDHGIESPDERREAGKDPRGLIMLSAFHRGGNIVIEIEDNGRGLDREAIIEKAVSRELIAEDHKLTDAEIYNLIFHPGFSTAKAVTDISGRGVGMDVVKKAIEKLRGRVEINTRPGHGSVFVISLPLTLAIIEGMLVRVGCERYIIPALAILESFRPSRDQYATVEGKGEMIRTRGTLAPLVRLHELFGVEGDYREPWEGLVVAVEHEKNKMCLFLDELLGKEEVVIKSLGGLKDIKGIAGGAIMGDGRVGLILDMSGIYEVANGKNSARRRA